MRKGILSLSMPGRGRASRKKTKNMELAEQTAVKKAVAADEAGTGSAPEKAFVQTVQIPKPGTVVKKKAARKHGMIVVPQRDDK